MNEAFCRTPLLFVAKVGRCVLNEARDSGKRQGGLVVYTDACYLGELDIFPVCHTKVFIRWPLIVCFLFSE